MEEWVLEGLDRDEALALIRAAREGGARTASERAGTTESGPGSGPRPTPREAAASAPVANPSPGTPFPAGDLPRNYEALRELALACTRCRLAGERTQVVFSDGNPQGRVMVVGEAPGAHEDRTGLPFVGAAGKLLDLLLASVDLSRRDSVYICNVIKCRPPGNRNPLPDELEACAPFLRRQIELVRPEAILGVGTFAAQLLTGRDIPLGRLRGEVYSYEGTPLVVTYHPAALLRNGSWTRATWDDLQLLRRVLDDAENGPAGPGSGLTEQMGLSIDSP
jgi:uracil-DNA glycosylase